MKTTKIIVKINNKSYPIYFGKNLIRSCGKLIAKNLPDTKKIFVIFDSKVPNIFLKKLKISLKKYELKFFKLKTNEKNKNIKVANKIIEKLLNENFNRSDCVIGLGGGVTGDLSAFISNLTKRGLKFINIPTTLLSQVDASIGGKTGINTKQGKNLIGTYYQPEFILSDLEVLNTLPKREIVAGYGEILKHGLIADKKFFLWLIKNGKEILEKKNITKLKNAIIKSCKIKSKIVFKDEEEENIRMTLNFGHTFAHGFEGASNFSKKINHGEAVLLGMIIASKLSNKRKLLSFRELLLIKKHYENLKLPMKINKYFKKKDINKILFFMKSDKKNRSKKINLILLNKIGKTTMPGKISLRESDVVKILKLEYN